MPLSPQQANCCRLLRPQRPACLLSSTISSRSYHSRATATHKQQRRLKPWTLWISKIRNRQGPGRSLVKMHCKEAVIWVAEQVHVAFVEAHQV